jgi:hypothetical protein
LPPFFWFFWGKNLKEIFIHSPISEN